MIKIDEKLPVRNVLSLDVIRRNIFTFPIIIIKHDNINLESNDQHHRI
jgi:hypothetical protein